MESLYEAFVSGAKFGMIVAVLALLVIEANKVIG
jgi:hypothetical protein